MAKQTGITAITIENFKGVGGRVTVPLRPITLLFGANSAGKSTIIQAIHYVRELLLRNNPDADLPLAGGNAIDLGGFRNMVHRHDLSRTIRIGFEITPDDDGLPGLDEVAGKEFVLDTSYWQTLESLRIFNRLIPDLQELVENIPQGGSAEAMSRLELLKRNQELVKGREPDISPFIRSAAVEFGVSWDFVKAQPWISEARFALDGTSLLTIKQESSESTAFLTDVAYNHPAIQAVFTPVLGSTEEDPSSAESEFEKIFLDLQDSEGRVALNDQFSVLPDLSKPLPLGISMETSGDDYGYELFIAAIVNQVVLGTTTLLKKEFDRFRYVGPIRERPARYITAPAVLDESRWADGTAAWHQILKHYDPDLKRGDQFVQQVSEWLSHPDKLDLGYSIDVQGHRGIPEESLLMANLRLLREKFEEKDENFYRQLVWPELEAAEVRPELHLYDLKNNVRVGCTDIGMGVIQAIPVVVASLDPTKRLLCLEQPELHLHPAAQAKMGDLLIGASKDSKILLVETHSELLILRLLKRIRQTTADELPKDALAITPADIGVIYVERCKDGAEVLLLEVDSEGEFTRSWPGKDGFFEERARELFE